MMKKVMKVNMFRYDTHQNQEDLSSRQKHSFTDKLTEIKQMYKVFDTIIIKDKPQNNKSE